MEIETLAGPVQLDDFYEHCIEQSSNKKILTVRINSLGEIVTDRFNNMEKVIAGIKLYCNIVPGVFESESGDIVISKQDTDLLTYSDRAFSDSKQYAWIAGTLHIVKSDRIKIGSSIYKHIETEDPEKYFNSKTLVKFMKNGLQGNLDKGRQKALKNIALEGQKLYMYLAAEKGIPAELPRLNDVELTQVGERIRNDFSSLYKQWKQQIPEGLTIS